MKLIKKLPSDIIFHWKKKIRLFLANFGPCLLDIYEYIDVYIYLSAGGKKKDE